ncbi:hypothetical protein [Ancylobacter radicis]|uniref:Uncharacterized protein n=1 Tax=Ancylobacter radicis TaxID=2836179 RepID=A0ABS5R6S9_9HYPH|nr:hypothetical protein [Ancylobacter radicis]MBS9476960.1 hypothetical protein [Ancylobacter radicis]
MTVLLRLLRLPFELVLTVLVLLDEAARPLYRPLLRWVAGLGVMRRFEAWIARLPRLAILTLLAIPFAFAEPLKFVALIWIADGHFKTGTLTLALAYLASFVIVERIYRAGEPKLMTYGWFAFLMERLIAIRTTLLGWVQATALFRAVDRARRRLRAWLGR